MVVWGLSIVCPKGGLLCVVVILDPGMIHAVQTGCGTAVACAFAVFGIPAVVAGSQHGFFADSLIGSPRERLLAGYFIASAHTDGIACSAADRSLLMWMGGQHPLKGGAIDCGQLLFVACMHIPIRDLKRFVTADIPRQCRASIMIDSG